MTHDEILLKQIHDAFTKSKNLCKCIDDIYIIVNDGAVVMAGSVQNEETKQHATKIVSDTPGVKLLIEDLNTNHGHRPRVDVGMNMGKLVMG